MHLEEAQALFSASGAPRYVERAKTFLQGPKPTAAVSRAGHAVDGDSLALLTRREREVANLLERRFTSRQIATELHLSERTVDKHVANILRKLDLHSREQIAAKLAERRSQPL